MSKTNEQFKQAAVKSTETQAAPVAPTIEKPPEPKVAFWMRSERRRAARSLWIAKVYWPLAKILGPILCMFNSHAWEEAPALDPDGMPVTDKPGIFQRCTRPTCRVYSGQPKLLQVENWLETDDFMVLANLACKMCGGRGYHRRMALPSPAGRKVTVQMPCNCLRLQPRFMKNEAAPGRGGKA